MHLLVRDDQTADGLGEVDEEGRVPHVIFRDLSLVITKFSQVFLAFRAENGQAYDRITDHNRSVLHQHAVIDAHQKALLQHKADVTVEFIKTAIDVAAFPLVAIVEGNFLGVCQQVAV